MSYYKKPQKTVRSNAPKREPEGGDRKFWPKRNGKNVLVAPHSLAAAIYRGDPLAARFREHSSNNSKMTLRFYVDAAMIEECQRTPGAYSYSRVNERDFPKLATIYHKISSTYHALDEDRNYYTPRLDVRFFAKTDLGQDFEFGPERLDHINLRGFLMDFSDAFYLARYTARHAENAPAAKM